LTSIFSKKYGKRTEVVKLPERDFNMKNMPLLMCAAELKKSFLFPERSPVISL